ncbi:MAG: PRC-barrel domain-containing protein [Anaerotardibacter sp.]
MKKDTYLTSELAGVKVYDARKPDKKIGKVHSFVFHPKKRYVVGFTVKRPDVALMFHRSDVFVAYDAFDVVDGNILISDDSNATGKAACKRLGVSWDECIIWQGLPLMTEGGKSCGYVGSVRFNTADGKVVSCLVDNGLAKDAVLGMTELPAECILGFRFGVGERLRNAQSDTDFQGAMIVSDDALSYETVGGLAEKAGVGYAKASHKASQVAEKVKPVADSVGEKAKPALSQAAEKTEEVVNKGAFALGAQLGKTSGMFASFKEEYKKARYGEDDT